MKRQIPYSRSAQLRRSVMALHKSGLSIRDIARQLKNGASPATIHRIITRAKSTSTSETRKDTNPC
jgi:IS30 family transposase